MVGNINDGVAFTTTSNEQNKKKDKNHVTCYRCGETGTMQMKLQNARQKQKKVLRSHLG